MKAMRWLFFAVVLAASATTLAFADDVSPGTGPYPAVMEVDPTLPTHTVYHPAALDHLGARKLPIVAFGNGSCRDDGSAYRNILTEIASHGFLIIATGPIGGTKSTERPRTRPSQLVDAIDWAVAENGRNGSRYFGKLNPKAIGVMGHSCGGLQALQVSLDPRVKTAVILNAGVFQEARFRAGMEMTRDDLAKLHAPTLYLDGGHDDMAYETANDDFARIASIPVFKGEMDVGHMATYDETDGGRFGQVVTAWLAWQLQGDQKAKLMFTGQKCGLCTDKDWKVQRKNIP